MAIIQHEEIKQVIDLTSPEGNVFGLIGMVTKTFKKLGRDHKAVMQEMMAGDYYNAVYVFNRELGDVFDVILPENVEYEKVMESRKQYENKEKQKAMKNNSESLGEVYLR